MPATAPPQDSSPPIASSVLTSDRQDDLTLQVAGNHLHPATGPGPDPCAASPLRLFLPGPMALQRLPGASGPSRGLPLPPGIEFQR